MVKSLPDFILAATPAMRSRLTLEAAADPHTRPSVLEVHTFVVRVLLPVFLGMYCAVNDKR